MKIESYTEKLMDDTVVMFLFHGVIKNSSYKIRNYNKKHIMEADFYSLLKSLKHAGGTPLDIRDLLEIKQGKQNSQPKSFIISFDDGFENNYSVAAPILDDLKIPSVFYITTNFIDKNLMSWIDQIDYAVEETKLKKFNLSFIESEVNVGSEDSRRKFLNDVRYLAKNNKDFFLKKEGYIDEIFSACRIEKVSSQDSSIDLKMSWDQVTSLNKNSLFTIGGHTHTHPIMSYLNRFELEQEVDVCLNYLQKANIKKVDHFSYPEGLAHCYNTEVIEVLKERGIVCSPTAIDGVNSFNVDLFHLKRVAVV